MAREKVEDNISIITINHQLKLFDEILSQSVCFLAATDLKRLKKDAEAFAAAMKYPPLGQRSWGPTLAVAHTGQTLDDYFKTANSFTLAIAMIETREALAALDDILALDGIDAVFVGPSDLSIALSDGRDVNPGRDDVLAALDHVLKRAKIHKKAACCFAPSPKSVRELTQKGFDLMAIGTDFGQLRQGARAQIEIARGHRE